VVTDDEDKGASAEVAAEDEDGEDGEDGQEEEEV
jgi:hypothetical protein